MPRDQISPDRKLFRLESWCRNAVRFAVFLMLTTLCLSSPDGAWAENEYNSIRREQLAKVRVPVGITYYVSNDGLDSNSGTSVDLPWRTINKVNVSSFLPGDAVLFRRGDEWYEALTITSSGTEEQKILFGNYGSGPRPRILGSIRLTAWSHVSGDIWVSDAEVTDPSLGAPHGGSQAGAGGYPGGAWFVASDGVVTWGHQEKYIDFAGDFAQLSGQYDWGWYGDHIYVFSTSDPETAYVAVQVSQRQYAIGMQGNNPQHHIVIEGFELLFLQSKGFYGGYPAREAHGLTIRNNHIGYVGIKGAASAYGLAVWHSDMLIRNNEIHDCGRRSVSYNVYATRDVLFENVTIDRNYFHHGYHTTGVDISNSGTDHMDGFVISNNLFEGDPTVDLGAAESFNSNHIWTDTNPDGALTNFVFFNNVFTHCHGKGLTVNGITNASVFFNTFYGVNPTLANYQAQLYLSGTVGNVVVRNNVFYNDVDPAFNPYFFCVKADVGQMPEIDMDRNLFFSSLPDASIVDIVGITGSYTMSEWDTYRSETGWDANSPAPQDPDFIDAPAGDLHLGSISPARGAGELIPGIAEDFDGQPRSDPPSLGAYSFGSSSILFRDGFESGDASAWSVSAQ